MLINKENLTNPAYIITGSSATAVIELHTLFKSLFCQSASCNNCVVCKQIEKRQHHAISWIDPENRYTNDDLEVIFQKTALTNDINQKHFFVLFNADTLGISSANSLLKLLEEPPQGYYFFLVTENQESILPTIVSRCIVLNLKKQTDETHILLPYFLSNTNICDFNQILDASKINEKSALELTEQIYFKWAEILKKSHINNDIAKINSAEKICNLLDSLKLYPPMPGSAKIYIKNLYLQIVSNL